mgnify:CR=1 FL=1
MNKEILAMLVCPIAKCNLVYDAEHQELISQPLKLAYPIRQGVPILLENAARHTDKDQ